MGPALVSKWVDVICVLLALAMCEATVDSLQNGMAASISGQYLKNLPLVWTRCELFVVPTAAAENRQPPYRSYTVCAPIDHSCHVTWLALFMSVHACDGMVGLACRLVCLHQMLCLSRCLCPVL